MERERLEKLKKKAELEKAEKDKSDKVKLFPKLVLQLLPNSKRHL